MSRLTAGLLLGTVAVALGGLAELGPEAPPSAAPPVAVPVVASPVVTRRPVVDTHTDVAPPTPAAPQQARASRNRPTPVGLPTLLLRIRSCESGPNGYATHGWALDANYTETNPASTASGAWQFLDSTWQSTTGLLGRAKDYSPAVQDRAALELYAAEGISPWLASRPCWGTK